MKRLAFWVIIILGWHLTANAQGKKILLDNITSKVKEYSAAHPTETAYFHFDKPYYAAGDTIYFKAYVTMGERHELSTLSGVIHVDLINSLNKIDQALILQLRGGIAWGDFALPDSLPKGNYRIRAYTNLMRNEGDEAFFERTITIGSLQPVKIPESAVKRPAGVNNKADIQFFPESGELIAGLRCKIAFKAIGPNGLGIDVKGVIKNKMNQEIGSFASGHLGMGWFYLTPVIDESYQAVITYANGTKGTIDLPKPVSKGISLTITHQDSLKIALSITSNNDWFQENINKNYGLVILSGGEAIILDCLLDNPVVNLTVPTEHLRTGVARITLFSPTGEPLCERLLFVQKSDLLKLNINSDKRVYNKREKVNLKLSAEVLDTISGHFSVSVIDESKVGINENEEHSILTDLLLTGELKGYVEQPGYYFSNNSSKTMADLDLLMLTHGYRRFSWKQVMNDDRSAAVYSPETGIEISGMAKSVSGKPLIKGKVTLIASNGVPLSSQTTDENGGFKFSNVIFSDSSKFMLKAVTEKGNTNTQIIYNRPVAPVAINPGNYLTDTLNHQVQTYLETKKNQHPQSGYVKGKTLREVKIQAVRKTDDYRSSSRVGPGNADQVLHAEDIEKGGGPLSERLSGKLRYVHIVFNYVEHTGDAYMNKPQGGKLSVVLDGVLMDPNFSMDNVLAEDVETVELFISPGNESIYGRPALVITTKRGDERNKNTAAAGILPIIPKGFYKAREFYSPKYDHPIAKTQSDLRSTIYWQPELTTDKNGNASFEYYNADGTGNYRVVVEGIDENGNIGRQVYKYRVE